MLASLLKLDQPRNADITSKTGEPAGTCEPVLGGDGRPPFCFFALTHSRPALSCLSRRRPPSSSPKKPRKVQRVRPSIFQVPPRPSGTAVCALARALSLSPERDGAKVHQYTCSSRRAQLLQMLVHKRQIMHTVAAAGCIGWFRGPTPSMASGALHAQRKHVFWVPNVVDPLASNYSLADAIRAIKEDQDVDGAFHGCAGIIPNSRNLGKTKPSCINLSRKGEDPLNRFFFFF